MVEHVNIADAQLHEPKGAAGAASTEVYIADGVGGGAFSKVAATSLDSAAATVGQQLTADGAGAASWEDAPGKVHGEMEVIGNTTPTPITTAGVYVKMAEGVPAGDHLGGGIVFSVDHLTVPSSGTYSIECNLSFEGGAGDIFKFDLGIGVGLTPIQHVARRKTPNADVGSVAFGGVHGLSASDQIYVLVQNETSTNNPIITDLNLFIYKISE